MRRIIYILIAIVMFSINIDNVNADNVDRCSVKDMLRVRGEANTVVIDRELSSEEVGKFNILIKGMTEDLRIHEKITDSYYSLDDAENGVITIKNVDGGNYVFKFYYFICNYEWLRTINLSLPKYNQFADNPICEGLNEEVDVCGRWYQGELNEETVRFAVQTYKENKKVEEENNKLGLFDIIINFFKDYYFYIIVSVVLIVVVTFLIVIKRKREVLE